MERFPIIKHRKLGAVSMINNGQDLHGSQVRGFLFDQFVCMFFYRVCLLVFDHIE
jgi:hypothetical protein